MIIAYIVFALVAVVAFLLTGKLALNIRIGIAIALFIVPSLIFTVWIIKTGDKPLEGSTIVAPKKISPGTNNQQQ